MTARAIPAIAPEFSSALLKLVLMAMALAAASLLLRDIFTIPVHVSLTPREGWNGYQADAAMNGLLYPKASALMLNPYPPLSFYLIGALGRLTGDAIIAGRLVSLVSFIAIVTGLMTLLRQWGANVLAALFAGLSFALVLLATTRSVATDNPELLGHAFQIQGLLLLLRPKPERWTASLLFVLGIFVRQTLVALPLAATLWLLANQRREARGFLLAMLVLALAGLIASLFLGADLLQMFAPAAISPRNFWAASLNFLTWGTAPLLVLAGLALRFRHDRWVRFAALYGVVAVAVALLLAAGGIRDPSLFFDIALALAIGGGLALSRFSGNASGLIALAYGAPLGLFLWLHFASANLVYSEPLERQTRLDIAFMEVRSGPVLCEKLALCYWAGKDTDADFLALSQLLRSGGGSRQLARLLAQGHYDVVQLNRLKPFAAGPLVLAALRARYRVQHQDNNGVFLVRR